MLIQLELKLSSSDGSSGPVLRKGLMMGGFFRIVLGGAVGAVLGILFVKKQTLPRPTQRVELLPTAQGMGQGVLAPPALAPQAPAFAPAPAVPPYMVPGAPPAPFYPAPQASAQAPVYYAPPIVAPAPPASAITPPPVYMPPAAPPAPAPVAPPPPAPPIYTAPVSASPRPVEAEVPVVEPAPLYVEPVVPPVPVAAPVEPEAVAPVLVEPEVVAPMLIEFEIPPLAPPASPEPLATAPVPPTPERPIVPSAWSAPETTPVLGEPQVPVAEPEPRAEYAEHEGDEVDLTGSVIPVDIPESDVVVSPEVLEEPVPGAGWEPSAVFVQEEAQLEELLPVVPDSVRPYEAPFVGDETAGTLDDAWAAVGWPDFDIAPPAKEPPAKEPSAGQLPAVGPAALEPVEMEPRVVEPVIEELAAEQAAFEPPLPEEPVFEPLITEPFISTPIEEPTHEERGSEFIAQPNMAAAEAALGQDLKSRIEETRRRIREELERPFAAVDEVPAPEPFGFTSSAPVPSMAPIQVVDDTSSMTPPPVNGGAPIEPAIPAQAVASNNGSDYEAMRARIELTRSRLKAKAFDAMMAGESALLGRDSEEAINTRRRTAAFDSEIERTVDNTLREDDH